MQVIPATKDSLAKLDQLLNSHGTMVILTHDYPDPDALASALLLSHLCRVRYRLRTRIAYGGVILRAENRTMVQQLKIKLTHIDDIQWHRYKLIAMVDTQPEFKNHGLPEEITPTVVIDHHKGKLPVRADFADIRTNYGASATMLLEYMAAAEIDIPVRIATAIAYAIRSETQELGRDASKADVDAYLEVYPKANKRTLSKINNPKLPKTYFILLATALEKAIMFRQLAHVHLGAVESPESVALIADLLLRHERMSWSLVTGRYKKKMFLSLRCNRGNANAAKCLKQIVGSQGFTGGHAQIAGGYIPFNSHLEKDWQKLEEMITERFSTKIGEGSQLEWKPFLANGLKTE